MTTVAKPLGTSTRGETPDTGPSRDFRGDIEIEILTERLDSRFLISPNDLHRGHGQWAGMTLRGRAILAALLTYPSGWKVTRRFVDDFAPELGHKGVSTILTELEERGHLSREKVNGEGGRFTWRWTIRMFPGHTTRPSGDDGRPTIVPSGDDGRDQEKDHVSAGRTIMPSATDGQGDVLRRTSSREVPKREKNLPPTPRADRPAPDVPQAVPGRGRNPEPEPHATAAAFVTDLANRVPQLTHAGPTDRARLAHVVADALTQGVPLPAIADAATVDLSGLDHPAAGLAARIRRLEPPPPPERPMPTWCGRCDKNRRMELDDATDQLTKCRECHPDAGRRRQR